MIEPIPKVSFEASYTYGPTSEHVKTPSRIITFLKPLLFTGSALIKAAKIDNNPFIKLRRQLRLLGAESITLKTPDGETIDGLYMDAFKFKKAVEHYLYKYESVNADGTITELLLVKPLYCKEVLQKTADGKSFFQYKQPNSEALQFLEVLKDICGQPIPYKMIKGSPDAKEYALEIGEYDVQLPLANFKEPIPTALLGHSPELTSYEYKSLIGTYLLCGMNVLMVGLRNAHKNNGTTSDFKTYLDLETAYQYLRKEKKLKNENLLIHSHSASAAAASDLAERRTGVNILLDKIFASKNGASGPNLPLIKKMTMGLWPSIFAKNLLKKLKKIKGQTSFEKEEGEASAQLDRFLDQLRFRRRLF